MRTSFLFTVLLAVLVAPSAAQACSIVAEDPRDRVARADLAVFARIVAAEPVGAPTRTRVGRDVRYRLEVLRTYKGTAPRAIEVVGNTDEASCGFGEHEVGERIGLLLGGRERPYEVGLGSSISRDELRRAVAPLPRGSGTGRVAVIAAGSFASAGLVALDRRGRILGYGPASTRGYPLGVCPGSQRLLAGPGRVVRVRDLRLVARRNVRFGGSEQLLRCLDPQGATYAAFVPRIDGADQPRSRLVAGRGSKLRVIHTGRATAAVLAQTAAILAEGSRLLSVDYASGIVRELGRLPAATGELSLSPGGTTVAAEIEPERVGPTRIVTLDLASGRTSEAQIRREGVVGRLHWLDDRRVTYVSTSGEVEPTLTFDAGLARLARFPGWGSRDDAVQDGVLWSIDFGGRLLRAALPGGPARVVRVLPHENAGPLVTVPGEPGVRLSTRAPALR